MEQIKVRPTGWGSVLRKTAVDGLGHVTVNVNSRGGVEVIRKAGDRDYRGWYAESPSQDGSPAGAGAVVEAVGRTTKHLFRAMVDPSGLVVVERQSASRTDALGFDLASSPDYRGATTAELEQDRQSFLGRG